MKSKHRQATERTYTDKCTVIEYKKYTKENKSTGYREVIVLKKCPCRVSFITVQSASQTDTGAPLVQKIKLFIAPETKIKPGSKLVIMNKTGNPYGEYSCSGIPAMYESHREILLEVFGGWA